MAIDDRLILYIKYRLEDFKRIDESTRCWLWAGSIDPSTGYGRISIKGKRHHTHRLSAFVYLGLDLDNRDSFACHRCNNRHCFNPDHIYVGSNRTNQRDVWGGVCSRGHQLIGNNLRVSKATGKRCCRECNRIMGNERYRRKQAIKLVKNSAG